MNIWSDQHNILLRKVKAACIITNANDFKWGFPISGTEPGGSGYTLAP